MSKKSRESLALAVGVSLLAVACGRGGREQSKAHPTAQVAQVAPEKPAPEPVTSEQPEIANSIAPLPSPFGSAPARKRSAGSRKPAPNAAKAAEPLVLATVAAAAQPVKIALPAPPSISPPAPDAGQLPPLVKTMCCVATAVYEPVRANGFERALRKVPGLRRLDTNAAAGSGYTPPQPVRDIRFAVLPDVSPLLMRRRRLDLKANVDASGQVTRVELLSPRDGRLADLVASAASAWRFAPAEVNGSPVPGEVLLHFDFDIPPTGRAAVDTAKTR